MAKSTISQTAEWQKFRGLFKEEKIPARTVLLQEGKVSKKAFLIVKGCIRVWFNNNGKEVTFQFFFEGEAVSSIESFTTGKAGIFNLETMEPSVLGVIHKPDFNRILAEYP